MKLRAPIQASPLGSRPNINAVQLPQSSSSEDSAKAARIIPVEGITSMATGTVKWFNDDKGFGFISPDESGKDLFVHHTGILGSGFKTLAEGARVSYDAEAGDKGPKAVNVQPL